jgi:hypothetical protein
MKISEIEINQSSFDESLDDPRLALHAKVSAQVVKTDTAIKQELIAGFREAQNGFIDSLNKSMEYAFQMGDILIDIKRITPHGQFEEVVKCDLQVVFGMRQVQKLMRISAHKSIILEAGKSEPLTIDRALALIAVPKTTPKTEIEEISGIKDTPSLCKGALEDVIEGKFTEAGHDSLCPIVDNEEYSDADDASDQIRDLIEENKRLEDDNAGMLIIFEDDDHVAAAIREIDKLKAINIGLESRLNGLMNENAAMKKQLNYLDSRCKKLDKQLMEFSHE